MKNQTIQKFLVMVLLFVLFALHACGGEKNAAAPSYSEMTITFYDSYDMDSGDPLRGDIIDDNTLFARITIPDALISRNIDSENNFTIHVTTHPIGLDAVVNFTFGFDENDNPVVFSENADFSVAEVTNEQNHHIIYWIVDRVNQNNAGLDTSLYLSNFNAQININASTRLRATIIAGATGEQSLSEGDVHPFFAARDGGDYVIASARHLYNMRATSTQRGATYVLENDINVFTSLSGVKYDTYLTEYALIAPINNLSGSFDGNHFTISNYEINTLEVNPVHVGLFSNFTGSYFKNVHIKDVIVSASSATNAAGGVFGTASGDIINVTITNVFITGALNTGGLVGSLSGGMTNINAVNVQVAGTLNAGGVVGFVTLGSVNNEMHEIDNLTVLNPVVNGSNAGGVVGVNRANIKNIKIVVPLVSGAFCAGSGIGKMVSGSLFFVIVENPEIYGNTAGGVVGDNSGVVDYVFVRFTDAVSIGNPAYQMDTTMLSESSNSGGIVGNNRRSGEVIHTTVVSPLAYEHIIGRTSGGIVGNNQGRVADALFLALAPMNGTDLFPIIGAGNHVTDEDFTFFLQGQPILPTTEAFAEWLPHRIGFNLDGLQNLGGSAITTLDVDNFDNFPYSFDKEIFGNYLASLETPFWPVAGGGVGSADIFYYEVRSDGSWGVYNPEPDSEGWVLGNNKGLESPPSGLTVIHDGYALRFPSFSGEIMMTLGSGQNARHIKMDFMNFGVRNITENGEISIDAIQTTVTTGVDADGNNTRFTWIFLPNAMVESVAEGIGAAVHIRADDDINGFIPLFAPSTLGWIRSARHLVNIGKNSDTLSREYSQQFDIDFARYQYDMNGIRIPMHENNLLDGITTNNVLYENFNAAVVIGPGLPNTDTIIPPFSGLYDGNQYTIRNLQINSLGGRLLPSMAGIFEHISQEGRVRNITLCDSVIEGGTNVGAIAGFSEGIISGIRIEDTTVSGLVAVGAVAGHATNTITGITLNRVIVRGCGDTGGVAGISFGEIIGIIINDLTIEGFENIPDVTGHWGLSSLSFGGISGESNRPISNVRINNMTISGTTVNGGIVGENYSDVSNVRLENVTISGTPGNFTGGIAGRSRPADTISAVPVINFVTITNLNINAALNVGGIAGSNQGVIHSITIRNYDIFGTSSVGGVAGVSGAAHESGSVIDPNIRVVIRDVNLNFPVTNITQSSGVVRGTNEHIDPIVGQNFGSIANIQSGN